MLLHAIQVALALTCDTPTSEFVLTTPTTVPPNAQLVVTYSYRAPTVRLADATGQPIPGTTRVEAGHVVWIPDADLSPGPHTLRIDGEDVPIEVDGPVDTTPPLPPILRSALREATDADEWGDPVDITEVAVTDVPAGSHLELLLLPNDGGKPLLAATDERVVDVGYASCGTDWPSGFDLDRRYTVSMRSVDAAGNTSSWAPVPVWTVAPDAEEATGCQTAPTVDPWGWLRRR